MHQSLPPNARPSTANPAATPATTTPQTTPTGALSPDAFEALYRARWPAIVDYLRFRIGPADAADVAADVFVRAWQARDQYESERGAPEAWLWGIARNGAKDWLRRHGAPVDPLDHTIAVDAGLIDSGAQAEAMAHVAAAIQQLEPIDRDIIALRFGGGLSFREVGAALGIAEAGAATRLHRAIKRLRTIVHGRDPS